MNVIVHPALGPQPAALIRTLGRFDRQTVEAFISVAIELLDVIDGDSDAEADDRGGETIALIDDPDLPPEDDDGDPDLEQTRDEDDWFDHGDLGIGCTLSDPGGQCDEDGINTNLLAGFDRGPGCQISDDDFDGEAL